MGPTDAALIPLGFCLTAGCTAPLVPWSGFCPVGHKHESSSATSGPFKSWRLRPQSPHLLIIIMRNSPTREHDYIRGKSCKKAAGVFPSKEIYNLLLLLNLLELSVNI